jgi:hypothetical protein
MPKRLQERRQSDYYGIMEILERKRSRTWHSILAASMLGGEACLKGHHSICFLIPHAHLQLMARPGCDDPVSSDDLHARAVWLSIAHMTSHSLRSAHTANRDDEAPDASSQSRRH